MGIPPNYYAYYGLQLRLINNLRPSRIPTFDKQPSGPTHQPTEKFFAVRRWSWENLFCRLRPGTSASHDGWAWVDAIGWLVPKDGAPRIICWVFFFSTTILPKRHTWSVNRKMTSDENPGWLGYIEDYTTQLVGFWSLFMTIWTKSSPFFLGFSRSFIFLVKWIIINLRTFRGVWDIFLPDPFRKTRYRPPQKVRSCPWLVFRQKKLAPN